MASHRMARGRKRADEILAFDPARRHARRHSRRHGQIALAHRARLRGTQKRARPRPFRRAKLARIPSSRRPLHRRLRFSHPRTSGDSPLRPPAARNVSLILASHIPRRRQSDPNGISKIRSRRSEDNSRSRWPEPSCAARVAKPCHHDRPFADRRDTVELGEAITTLVAVDLSGATPTQVLVSRNDFYSTPRLSPDGSRMSWLTWRHPDMPWVATEAWVGDILPDGTIGNPRRVAGGPNESVFQTEWSPDGDLYFVSDRGSGWWNLYRERNGAIEPIAEMDAEVGRPQWQFGMSTYAFESADRLISCFVRDGVWTLVGIDTRSKRFDVIPTEFTDIAQLRAAPGRLVFIGGSPSDAAALVDLDLNNGTHRVLRRSFVLREDVRRYVSAPQPIVFPTGGGEAAHAFYYPPFSPEFAAPADERAPVLVKSHGGPTSAASSTLSLSAQYWTSRGVGVLDVNYRGSTGYGRPYRLRLERQWGFVDVEDCVAGARWLIEYRNADPERLMISGGSAGGYTTLCALTPKDDKVFSGGASYYGVSDLEALARDTHKFESRYLDWLIGPYPEDRETYAERSPINHVDRLSAPIIFFQGSEDRVVPPNQTELMVAALKKRGVPVGYFLFDGEQHGFRKAENIRRALDAELYFYAMLILRSGLRF